MANYLLIRQAYSEATAGPTLAAPAVSVPSDSDGNNLKYSTITENPKGP